MSDNQNTNKTGWIHKGNRKIIALVAGTAIVIGSAFGVQAIAGSKAYEHMRLSASFDGGWHGREVWVREFEDDRARGAFEVSDHRKLRIEPPDYFATERPDAERMSYQQLDRYIDDLSASGVDVVALRVELARKLSFPFVTLILTLIAVPFAVSAGRHGALYGIGIGIVLAISYWIVISIFAAIGSAGLLTPLLAAWAPNVLFGGSAVYMLLAVRT